MNAVPLPAQRLAATPDASVWVAASAGSGKTKVLVDRVLGLLLAGTRPHRILCLTFTRAAAAEMSNRIRQELGDWAASGDDELDEAIAAITGEEPNEATRRRAQRLFAEVLDAPGGMKIQTIHSFCESVLGRFPLEAGIAPHFEVMDERTAAEAMHAARDGVLLHAQTGDDDVLAEAVAAVTGRISETEFADLMTDLARERGRLARLFRKHGLAGLDRAIRDHLGVAAGVSEIDVIAAASGGEAFDEPGLRAACRALLHGSKTDRERGATIAAWLENSESRVSGFGSYCKAFLTKDETVRARLITQGAQAVAPEADDCLQTEGERLAVVLDQRRKAGVAAATGALLTLAQRLLAAYEAHKTAHALLDYDDLIERVRVLLESDGGASWALFKLDGGIDHILIDEAQDTNPDQWAVVKALASEFFAHASDAGGRRTVFAVGDAKQSIFSFQGADPAEFARMREYFEDRAAAVGKRWETVGLDVSFRSTSSVLRAVDAVFTHAAARDGLGEDDVSHSAQRAGQAGLVELWPPIRPAEREERSPWTPPRADGATATPSYRLARGLALRIHDWVTNGEMLECRARAMTPGDIMVLVRRRTRLVDELVEALKDLQVPVAGVDRMVLSDHLAIMDLVALGHFLLLPEDDLILATVLKGPLIGFDEEQLFDLAYDRGAASLWQRLADSAHGDPRCRAALDLLAHLRARVDFAPPHELYAEILGSLGGRQAMVASMGEQANDPLDEFLTLALAYERAHPPSLQGFLRWFAEGRTEVKRDLEQTGRDEVRVMTVHGAKGLEAPVVILADTMQTPGQSPRLLWSDHGAMLPFWAPRRDNEDTTMTLMRADANRARDREYRRLLYVAMTRAEDRLIICGYETRQATPDDCWYELVRRGLADVAQEVEFDLPGWDGESWSGPGLRLHEPQSAETADPGRRTAATTGAIEPLPSWARETAPDEPVPPRPLAPSRPGTDEPGPISPIGGGENASLRRGVLVHRLLQSLPDVAPERRREAVSLYLAQPVHRLDAEERDSIAAEVTAVMDEAAFAPLFAPGSRGEVPIVGRIGEKVISGRIDRLAVSDDAVLIVDYKAGRAPPETVDDVPGIYLDQLAAYRSVLAEVYPGRDIRTALLWTAVPRLMPIEAALLERR